MSELISKQNPIDEENIVRAELIDFFVNAHLSQLEIDTNCCFKDATVLFRSRSYSDALATSAGSKTLSGLSNLLELLWEGKY